MLSQPLWRPSSLNGQFPSSRHWHFSYQTSFGHRQRDRTHSPVEILSEENLFLIPRYPLRPSAPRPPYSPSPAATLCCPSCFIISLGVCGPPLLSFDGVQKVKAWRQPVNFPCCDSPTARGQAIFPLRHSQLRVLLMRMLSALLSTTAYLNCPPFRLSDYFVWGLVTGLIRAAWGRGWCSRPSYAAAGDLWFNLQFDLIIQRDVGKSNTVAWLPYIIIHS